MTEDLSEIFDNTKASMKKAMAFFESELSKIRAGKASPVMLDGIVVDYYGNPTPLGQVANVSADGCTYAYHSAMGKKYASTN